MQPLPIVRLPVPSGPLVTVGLPVLLETMFRPLSPESVTPPENVLAPLSSSRPPPATVRVVELLLTVSSWMAAAMFKVGVSGATFCPLMTIGLICSMTLAAPEKSSVPPTGMVGVVAGVRLLAVIGVVLPKYKNVLAGTLTVGLMSVAAAPPLSLNTRLLSVSLPTRVNVDRPLRVTVLDGSIWPELVTSLSVAPLRVTPPAGSTVVEAAPLRDTVPPLMTVPPV